MDVKINKLVLLSIVLLFFEHEVQTFGGFSSALTLPMNGALDPKKLDDGSDGKWLNGTCTNIFKNLKAWWRVDLKVVHKVASVKVMNKRGCCSNAMRDVQIRIGMNSRDPSRNTLCKYYRNAIGSGMKRIIKCRSPRRGRFVFVTFKSLADGYLSLCGVEVNSVSKALLDWTKNTEKYSSKTTLNNHHKQLCTSNHEIWLHGEEGLGSYCSKSTSGCYDNKRRTWFNFTHTFSPSPCLNCKCNTNSSITCNRSLAIMQTDRPFCKDCSMKSWAIRYACKTCYDNVNNKTYAYRQSWKIDKCSKCFCKGKGNDCMVMLRTILPALGRPICRKCNIAAFMRRYPCRACYNAVGRKYSHGQYWEVNGTCVKCQCIAGTISCARTFPAARASIRRPSLTGIPIGRPSLTGISIGKPSLTRVPICANCNTNKLNNYLKRYDCKVCYNDVTNVTVRHKEQFQARGFTCECSDGILSCSKVITADEGLLFLWFCHNCSVTQSIQKFKQQGCTFQGKWIENGKTTFIGFGQMPYCMKCLCFNGNVRCSYADRPNISVKIRSCASNESCSAATEAVSSACQRDVGLNCYTAPSDTSWWTANGCNYSCSAKTLNHTYIEKPWCQSLVKSEYCAICPDQGTFLKQYGHMYAICERKTKLILREQICDGIVDCAEETDEKNCPVYYCKRLSEKIKKTNFVWERAAVDVTKNLPCRHIQPHWEGDLIRTCQMNKSAGTFWTKLDFCKCHDTRPDPLENEDLSNTTAQYLKDKARRVKKYTENTVNLEKSLELALILVIKALEHDFAGRNVSFDLKSFSSTLRDIRLKDGKLLCKKAGEKAKLNQLKLKLTEFDRKYNISHINRGTKHSGIKLWSINHSDFLQDVLFPESDAAGGLSIDSLQDDQKSKHSVLGGGIIGSLNQTNSENTSMEGVISKAKPLAKTKETSIHLKIQLIMDITFAMISLIALAVAVFLLFGFHVPATTKLFIHKNLFVARIISTLLYVVGSWAERDLKRKGGICTTFMILQYCSSLATFSWMLVEGINLFNVVVLVFQTKRNYNSIFAATGWGIPLFSFIICIAAKPDAFLQNSGCISVGILGWLFKGPVAILLGINFILFVLILWMVIKNVTSSQRLKTSPQKLRSTMRAFFTLVPVLGVAEILGFAIESSPVVVGYIHILVNGCIGLLFPILHCFMDAQVQEAVKKYRNQRRKSAHFQSSQFVPRSPATSFSCAQNDNEAFVHDTKL